MKLDKKGFSPWFIKWISSYLSQRIQFVKWNNELSSDIEVTSGVPQGSHLGPLLFLIFIDDLFDLIENSEILFYADDCKIFKAISCESDAFLLQHDLNNLCEWCIKNLMDLNLNKCQVLTFYRRKNPISKNYFLMSHAIERVNQFNDLGVLVDHKLSFNLHYEFLKTSVNIKLGLIFRFGKEFQNVSIYKSLYSSLVRPNLEYCSVVWCPQYSTHIKSLESIQKQFVLRALRNLPWNDPIHLPPYEDRCNLLRLSTLEKRREMINVLFLCKVIRGDISLSNTLNLICFNVPRHSTRFYNFLKYDVKIRNNYLKFEPLNVMITMFNENSSNIDFNMSYETIKNNILCN